MSRPRVSISYSVVMLAGVGLAVAGAVLAALGAGGPVEFGGAIGEFEVSTSSVGLAIMVVGAAMALVVAIKKPPDVRVLGGRGTAGRDEARLRTLPLVLAAVVVIGLALLLLSFLL